MASGVPASKCGGFRRRSNLGGRSRAISGVAEAVIFGPNTFVVRVDGSDMAPRFRRGDFVYVDPDASEKVGRFVPVRDEASDATAIRQLVEVEGRRVLRALGGDRPDRDLDTDGESLIRGVVLFQGRGI